MFEQTFLDHAHTGARRPWPVAISLAGQSAFVLAILAVPLFQTARLAWTPPVPLLFMPPKPVVLEVVRTPITAAQAVAVRPVFRPSFTAPARIPARIVTTPDPDPGSFLPQQLTGAAPYADPLAGITASATIPRTAPDPKPSAVRDSP